jgi:hypothetical protein
MRPLDVQREWHATAAAAVHVWPATRRDELLKWLWSRSEPALRILATVIEQPNRLAPNQFGGVW